VAGRRDPARGLNPTWAQRIWLFRAARRRGGRLPRVVRRLLAVGLLLAAGAIALLPDRPPDPGEPVLVLTRDLPIGSTLADGDVAVALEEAPPDGALADPAGVTGRTLAAAARRGEVLTDVRLVAAVGPDPGPGRAAVPVRPADPAIVDLLQPGMRVAVLTVAEDGSAEPLAADAVVLQVAPAPERGPADRPIVLSVPADVADRLAAATLAGSIALRFA
jgi:pilus assembly protein CpaB